MIIRFNMNNNNSNIQTILRRNQLRKPIPRTNHRKCVTAPVQLNVRVPRVGRQFWRQSQPKKKTQSSMLKTNTPGEALCLYMNNIGANIWFYKCCPSTTTLPSQKLAHPKEMMEKGRRRRRVECQLSYLGKRKYKNQHPKITETRRGISPFVYITENKISSEAR